MCTCMHLPRFEGGAPDLVLVGLCDADLAANTEKEIK